MFSKYNKVYVGIIVGFIVPFISYAIVLLIYDKLDEQDILNSVGLAPNFRERTVALIALVSNVIPIQFFNRKNWLEAMRGMVFPTLIYVALWMYLYGLRLLNL